MNWEKLSYIALAIVSLIVILLVNLAQIFMGCKPDMRKGED